MAKFYRLAGLLLVSSAVYSQNVITTVAGTPWIFRGDGGPALNAPLGFLRGVATDRAGNVFVADTENRIVVKVSPAGVLTVVAGNGLATTEEFSGEGGPATSASLGFPSSLAMDSRGFLLIGDTSFGRILRVEGDGRITRIAGGKGHISSGDGGPSSQAGLIPWGLTVDGAGNIFIAELDGQRVRKIDGNGIITTVAGNGVAGFSGDGGSATAATLNYPGAVAVDAAGNLYITDQNNNRVRRVNPSGIITTFAGGGSLSTEGVPATSAVLQEPFALAFDSAGNLLVVERSGSRVRRINAAGTITTVAGQQALGFSGDGGPATSARLNLPEGLAVDGNGSVYIADTYNRRLRKVTPSGTISSIAGNGLYKFRGDGGPAVSAALYNPMGIALAPDGSLYIADNGNSRIRKVRPDGVITTIAGTDVQGFSGDGGPASSAQVAYPVSVAVDATGNVFLTDRNSYRVRRIRPDGIITTVAGNGGGLSGDGGPATDAGMAPFSVRVDGVGNLYICETVNHRIRKVTPNGIISTVAGSGPAGSSQGGFSGDGGPATSARLNEPQDIALDSSGNLFIADTLNHRVRKVSTSGVITTVAGNGSAGSSGDGGPALSAQVDGPSGLAVDLQGNLYIADYRSRYLRRVTPAGIIDAVAGGGLQSGDGIAALDARFDFGCNNCLFGLAADSTGNLLISDFGNDRVVKMQVSAPSFALQPTSLSLTASAGATSGVQSIAISGTVTGLAWTAQAPTQSGGNWLLLSASSGTMPATVLVSADTSSLAPGTYQGTVTVQSPLTQPNTRTVAITLTVTPAIPAQLAVEPASLTYELAPGSAVKTQAVRILNTGGGTLSWTVTAETASGGNWLQVSVGSGTATPSSPATLQVTASSSGLAAGTHAGAVLVSGAGQTQRIPVTLLVTTVTQTILVSQSGLLFTAVQGGSLVPSQTVGILNVGQGVMNWSAEAGTFSGGNWLRVTPASGSSDAASSQVPLIEVQVDATGLTAGRYAGMVRIGSSGANNSPQLVTVDLNVLPVGSNPGVLVRPTGLIFAGTAGASSPGSQAVRVSTAATGSTSFVGGLLTFSGGDWLQALPRNATLSPGDPRTLIFQPAIGTLAPGIYRGAMTLLFADGALQNVNVLLVVVAAAAGSEANGGVDAPCVPSRLLAVHRTLGSSFASPVGWATQIEAQVADDCGNAIANATVLATFSNGDAPLVLNSLRNGVYSATWRPVNPATQTTVTVRASLAPLQPAVLQTLGQVSANPNVPVLYPGGVVNGASFAKGGAVAPGSIVSVFGQKLASGLNYAVQLPLEKTLGGATLNIGGVDAPLFFAGDGQVNAQVPFELAPNTRPQAVVKSRGTAGSDSLTVPDTINVGSVQPGIFTLNQQGTGQGAILDVQGRLVDAAVPVKAGEVIQIFCTGLGATQPAVASGQAAPPANLALVINTVSATVGGRPAVVQFSGLAPGFVGLYQVNVQIPSGVTPGIAVAITLSQQGVASNVATIAVRE